jgi:hypothetical protein
MSPCWERIPILSPVCRSRSVRATEKVIRDEELAAVFSRIVGLVVRPILGRVEVGARA